MVTVPSADICVFPPSKMDRKASVPAPRKVAFVKTADKRTERMSLSMLLLPKDLIKRLQLPFILVRVSPILPLVKKLQILPFVIGGMSCPSVS